MPFERNSPKCELHNSDVVKCNFSDGGLFVVGVEWGGCACLAFLDSGADPKVARNINRSTRKTSFLSITLFRRITTPATNREGGQPAKNYGQTWQRTTTTITEARLARLMVRLWRPPPLQPVQDRIRILSSSEESY